MDTGGEERNGADVCGSNSDCSNNEDESNDKWDEGGDADRDIGEDKDSFLNGSFCGVEKVDTTEDGDWAGRRGNGEKAGNIGWIKDRDCFLFSQISECSVSSSLS